MEDKTQELMEKLARLEGLMHRYQGYMFRSFGPWSNPMKGQGRVLAVLKLQPVISQKELSYLLDMRQQSLSELLGKLERSGLITRAPSQEDRRVTMVSLTEAGREAAEKMSGEELDLTRVFAVLDEEEQERFAGYLDRLTDAFESEMEANGVRGPEGSQWNREGHSFTEACDMGVDHIRRHMAEWGFGVHSAGRRARGGPGGHGGHGGSRNGEGMGRDGRNRDDNEDES